MEENTEKKKRTRSPNFPTSGLKKALELAMKLYGRYGKHNTAWDVAITYLGYTPKSSAGLQAMASLSYYGLMNIQGTKSSRKVNITDLAFSILMDDRENSFDRDSAIQRAALSTTMFNKNRMQYPHDLPADESLRHELVMTHKFNPASVPDFIKQFKETMAYAKIYESGIIGEGGEIEDEESEGAEQEESERHKPPSFLKPPKGRATGKGQLGKDEMEIAKYPVGKNTYIRLIASGPITQKSIEKLSKLLDINKDDFPEDIPESDESSDN